MCFYHVMVIHAQLVFGYLHLHLQDLVYAQKEHETGMTLHMEHQ